MTDAALGTTASVASLSGIVELEVPPGTQPGEVRVLKGQGMPALRGGRRGSLHVRLDVAVPTVLDGEQRRLVEELDKTPRPGRLRGPGRGRRLLQPAQERAPLSGLRRVSFTVPSEGLEIARAWLLERFPAGFEEGPRAGRTELAVYTEDGGEGVLRAAFPGVLSEEVAEGWEDRWKEFHSPVRAGGLWIGPPWIPPPAGEIAVVVDPGRAFGTGAHATTRACIELLSRIEPASLLDAGCGSGVLAVAAAKLGFGPVVAVDSDPVAVDVARRTASANAVEIDVRVVDVLADPLPGTDVLVANIELGAVETLLPRAAARTAVTSGYLATDSPRATGWATVERLELEGWAADARERAH